MQIIVKIVLSLAIGWSLTHTPAAMAQGAWSYLEVLVSSSSVETGTRWSNVETVCDRSDQSDEVCLSLVLPRDLVGLAEIQVTLRGPQPTGDGSVYVLQGDQATAHCVGTSVSRSCLVTFTDLAINSDSVEAYLRDTVTGAAQLTTALFIADLFGRSKTLRYWHGIM